MKKSDLFLQVFFDYLDTLRGSKKVEMFDLKTRLLRKFPNLNTKQAEAIFRMWLLTYPYKYLEKCKSGRNSLVL